MLYTTVDLCIQMRIVNMLLYIRNDTFDIGFPFMHSRIDLCCQILIYLRHQILHGQVIQFYLDLTDTKTMCDWCIDIHCFTRFFHLFRRRLIL